MTNIILTIWSFCFTPQPARLWLMLVFSPDHGDVEVNPEEDVDDEDADGGLGELWDVPSVPFVLQPDIDPYHQENAWNELIKCLQHKSILSYLSGWSCSIFSISTTTELSENPFAELYVGRKNLCWTVNTNIIKFKRIGSHLQRRMQRGCCCGKVRTQVAPSQLQSFSHPPTQLVPSLKLKHAWFF